MNFIFSNLQLLIMEEFIIPAEVSKIKIQLSILPASVRGVFYEIFTGTREALPRDPNPYSLV